MVEATKIYEKSEVVRVSSGAQEPQLTLLLTAESFPAAELALPETADPTCPAALAALAAAATASIPLPGGVGTLGATWLPEMSAQ